MENLGIDENTRNTGGGIIQGTDLTLPIFVNPSTNELLVEIHPVGSDGTAIAPRNLNIHAEDSLGKGLSSGRNVAGAITDDSDEFISPITVNMHLDVACLRIET